MSEKFVGLLLNTSITIHQLYIINSSLHRLFNCAIYPLYACTFIAVHNFYGVCTYVHC